MTIEGTLADTAMNMDLVPGPGGGISGSGSINEWANFYWTGGIFALAGGMTNYGGFTISGDGGQQLDATITNESPFANIGGQSLILGQNGYLINFSGMMEWSLPTVIDTAGTSDAIQNLPLGFLNINSPGTPVNFYASFQTVLSVISL